MSGAEIPWRDESNLLDILKAARLAVEFKGQTEKTEFLADFKTQSALLHQILIIGEAAKRLSAEFRGAHPEVPWKLIAGTRDKLKDHRLSALPPLALVPVRGRRARRLLGDGRSAE